MTHASPSVAPLEHAAAECPRACFILMDGTKVLITYCPEGRIETIDEHLPVPRLFTYVLPAIDGPGVFLVSFKDINPMTPAERLPA